MYLTNEGQASEDVQTFEDVIDENAEFNRKIKQILITARKTISVEENWCKYHSARNKAGDPVPSNHPDAAKFCMIGSVSNSAFRLFGHQRDFYINDAYNHLFETMKLQTPYVNVPAFNDSIKTTHEQVLKVFDQAIAKLEI